VLCLRCDNAPSPENPPVWSEKDQAYLCFFCSMDDSEDDDDS
jgi:hypothetical protein